MLLGEYLGKTMNEYNEKPRPVFWVITVLIIIATGAMVFYANKRSVATDFSQQASPELVKKQEGWGKLRGAEAPKVVETNATFTMKAPIMAPSPVTKPTNSVSVTR